MRYALIIFSVLASIVFVSPVYPAEDSCSYCGVWVPFSPEYDSSYSSNDRLTITEQTIALPGCQPVKSTQVFLTDKTSYGAPEMAHLKPLKVILQIERPMNCVSPLPGLSDGALVEIELRPRGYENSEELALVFFGPTTLEELKASYAYQLVPTPLGQKQKITRPPRPPELGGWWFIREEYDPCSEGAGRGSWICSAIKHKKADESLNTEWNRLLTIIPSKAMPNMVSIQKKWLKACSTKCAKEGVDKGYHPWGLAYETFCLAEEKADRSQELRALFDCMSMGKRSCPQLKIKP